MSDFLLFLGRLHVVVLHLPIGMLLLTMMIDVLGRDARRSSLLHALPLCWAATAASAVLTVVLGALHIQEGGFEGAAANAHRAFGISVALGCVALWLLISRWPVLFLTVRVPANVLMLLLVIMTGHYGGKLTHGQNYLSEFAPQPLRSLLGLPAKRAAPATLAAADPWHDVVNPLLQTHCSACHNADKRRGQLDLSSLAGLQAGSESGAVVTAGNAAMSELHRRISLPAGDEDFMPADGKTPLSEPQVRLIGWWLDAGMPVDVSLQQLSIDTEIQSLIATELGLAPLAAEPVSAAYPAVAPQTLESLTAMGWLLRPLSQNSNGLLVSLGAPGQVPTDAMLQALNPVASSIVELNLGRADLTDVALLALGAMPALETLQLGNNEFTDAGMATIAGYQSLRVLNLFGNSRISDVGLQQLNGLLQLQSLYVGGTGVTPAGLSALRDVLPTLTIHSSINVNAP